MPRRPAQAAPRRRLSDHPRRLRGAHRTQRALDDWRSSIIDGRLASQRARADALFKEAGVKLVYLLEGTMPTWTSEYIYGVQNQALASSIPLTSLRDDYHVVHAPHARLDGGGHRARGGPARERRTETQAYFRRGGGAWQAASRCQGYPSTPARPPRRHHWRLARDGRVARLQVRVRLRARRGERGGGGGHYTQEWEARWERGCEACEALLLLHCLMLKCSVKENTQLTTLYGFMNRLQRHILRSSLASEHHSLQFLRPRPTPLQDGEDETRPERCPPRTQRASAV